MKKIFNLVIALSLVIGMGWGCAGNHSSLLPTHDEVLTYPLPYDLVYLRTLEAIQQNADWDLDWTDKEKGVISIRNMRYSSFADADKRQALLLVKRVNEKETTVQFDSSSQSVVGGDEVLSLIRGQLSREVSLRGSR